MLTRVSGRLKHFVGALSRLKIKRGAVVVFADSGNPTPDFGSMHSTCLEKAGGDLCRKKVHVPFVIECPGGVGTKRMGGRSMLYTMSLCPALYSVTKVGARGNCGNSKRGCSGILLNGSRTGHGASLV